MKSPHLAPLLTAAAFIVPAIAHAHPGHDGDHDFVWDFGHVASHPLASAAYLVPLVAALWGVRRLVLARLGAKAERARRK